LYEAKNEAKATPQTRTPRRETARLPEAAAMSAGDNAGPGFRIADGIDIAPLLSAFEQFRAALAIAQTDLERAGTIQYFEFTYELAWKTMRRVLKARGRDLNSPKPVLREAALEGLIDDPEAWFGFLGARNETVHTYQKAVADRIFSELALFEAEVAKLIARLKMLK
jgi:nucleotidyltransferase substrate binding protein (TIGR01987 family)